MQVLKLISLILMKAETFQCELQLQLENPLGALQTVPAVLM